MVEESKVIMYHNKKYVIVRMIKLYDINYAYLTNIISSLVNLLIMS